MHFLSWLYNKSYQEFFLAHCTLGYDDLVFLDHAENKIGIVGHNGWDFIQFLHNPNFPLSSMKPWIYTSDKTSENPQQIWESNSMLFVRYHTVTWPATQKIKFHKASPYSWSKQLGL